MTSLSLLVGRKVSIFLPATCTVVLFSIIISVNPKGLVISGTGLLDWLHRSKLIILIICFGGGGGGSELGIIGVYFIDFRGRW